MLDLIRHSDAAIVLAALSCLFGYVCGLGMMATLLWPRLHRHHTGCERLLRLAIDDRDRRIAELDAQLHRTGRAA